MLPINKADELVRVAMKQLSKGLDAQSKRMKDISEYNDLYNNKVMEVDSDIINVPFPYFANFIDQFHAKIDNSPTVGFKLPNKKALSDKIQAAWEQERSSSRSGWNRKDRSEKKTALIAGRGVSKIYATSLGNKYKSHYDLVDIFSFIADPTRGRLMDGNYHGETDIFKTNHDLKLGVDSGLYDATQVKKIQTSKDEPLSNDAEIVSNKFNRLKALGIDIGGTSYVGQQGTLFTEWIMRYEGVWHYLLFDPRSGTWIRAELLRDVMHNDTSPFVSWATHYDEYAFWSKSIADDVAPVTEAMRLAINNAMENDKRRTRPMRIVEGGSLVDVNELMDYVPDNVIVTANQRNSGIVTVETPEISGTLNLLDYLDKTSQSKMGLQGSGVSESDAKVGIFFGQLQKEADRIGIINKEYSESYADKGYNFFWGLKQHLTKPKQIEMLGSSGMKLQQLATIDFKDVDDVDDIIVSGGSAKDELDAVETERRQKVIGELTAAYPDKLNPAWVIKESLRSVNFEEDAIEEAQDIDGALNRELIEEADTAIQEILLGKTPRLNRGADTSFMQRIQDFVTDEMDYIKLDKNGQVSGVDKKMKETADKLLKFMFAHQEIVIKNNERKLREEQFKMTMKQALGEPEQQGAQSPVNIPPATNKENQNALARPFENNVSTPEGAASASQNLSNTLRP